MNHRATKYHRSRTPEDTTEQITRQRSRSPRHHRHHHRRHHASSHESKTVSHPAPVTLPMGAQALRKHDYASYRPMFGLYLEIQKQLMLEDLSESEVKGRWKSFVGKWNRGELAEGWYEPATLQKAQASAAAEADELSTANHGRSSGTGRQSSTYEEQSRGKEADGTSDEEDGVGPALPGTVAPYNKARSGGGRSGPAIPNMQDLEMKDELESEDRDNRRSDLRHARQLDLKTQKERLDELVPRAEAGSKDRMLEKKREKATANRAFASGKTETGGVEEVPESELLGGDEDGGLEGMKKQKREMERKKNERELRKDEIMRARKEELEERVAKYKAKEERTMKGLVELARARFG